MEWLKECITWENVKFVLWILFGSGVVCQVTPFIKFNPISLILNWTGKQLNKDVKEDIKLLKEDVKTVQDDLQTHKIESWRREILNFSDSLSLGKCKSKEQFLYHISLHDNYVKYIEERKLTNGQMDAAFNYILKCYNECLENNSFFTGK